MSSSSSRPVVPLTVHADSRATEIFVIDSRFRRVARGVGDLHTELPPGYYKVRFRAGTSQRDQLVELNPTHGPATVQGEPIEYHSSAPLAGTSTTSEVHAEAAERLSNTVHGSPGRGSRLFLFARDVESRPAEPWQGVSLHALDGEQTAELADGECRSEKACAGLSLELDPGTYRLRVDSGPLGVYEMFIVTCEGWQTQVFSAVEDFTIGSESVRRVALRSTTVLMSRIGCGFSSGSRDVRLADLARVGLRTGRKVVRASDLREMLSGKFDNPMLGIYGGHLLLLAMRPKHDLIDEVVGNLMNLVGSHPDAMALELRGGERSTRPVRTFPNPPMLRSSWDLIVQASRRRVSMVPPGSPSDRVADGLVQSSPWLLRRLPEIELAPDVGTDVSFSGGRRLLERIASLQQSHALASKMDAMRQRSGGLSPLERSLLVATQPLGTGTDREETSEEYARRVNVSKILSSIDAPASSIARSARSLFKKLELDDLES